MKATTADRLKEAMNRYELRQADILKRAEPFCKQFDVKLGRNDLSQYVSGKVSPGQEKLTVLALALGVSETWLMGYDVPMERISDKNTNIDLTGSDTSSQVLFVLEKLLAEGTVTIENAQTGERKKISIDNGEWTLLKDYNSLNKEGQTKANEQVSLLTKIPEYQNLDAGNLRNATIIEFQAKRNSDLFVIPYYRGGISAGTGIFILGNEAEDDIEIPNILDYQDADYALDVNGDSMEPDYMDGDIALVSQNMEMQIGDIGVFVVNGSAYIKELGKNELISHNKDYPHILIHEEDNVVCMGKVIGKLMD